MDFKALGATLLGSAASPFPGYSECVWCVIFSLLRTPLPPSPRVKSALQAPLTGSPPRLPGWLAASSIQPEPLFVSACLHFSRELGEETREGTKYSPGSGLAQRKPRGVFK